MINVKNNPSIAQTDLYCTSTRISIFALSIFRSDPDTVEPWLTGHLNPDPDPYLWTTDTDPVLVPDPDPYYFIRFKETSEKVQYSIKFNDLLLFYNIFFQ